MVENVYVPLPEEIQEAADKQLAMMEWAQRGGFLGLAGPMPGTEEAKAGPKQEAKAQAKPPPPPPPPQQGGKR